jgi:hypothetical protein
MNAAVAAYRPAPAVSPRNAVRTGSSVPLPSNTPVRRESPPRTGSRIPFTTHREAPRERIANQATATATGALKARITAPVGI